MNLMESPSRIFDLGNLRRFCGGKPPIEKIGWFRDHIYWHRDAVIDADNISFTLEEDPGPNRVVFNGETVDVAEISAPKIGSTNYGLHITTLATTRRNELLFRYRHEDMCIPEHPLPLRHFTITSRFLELFHRFSDNLDLLSEPGIADQQDLLALQMISEAIVSAETAEDPASMPDPRIKIIASRIMSRPDEDFNIESVAAELGFSRAAFYREWDKFSDEPPYRLLLDNRLRSAEWFLTATTMPIKEIVQRSGFRNPSVFTESFKKRFGVSPREFRKLKAL